MNVFYLADDGRVHHRRRGFEDGTVKYLNLPAVEIGLRQLARIRGPQDLNQRGGTITVTFYDVTGKPFDDRRVEELGNQANISLRTG